MGPSDTTKAITALTSQGFAVGVIADLSEAELSALAMCVSQTGEATPETRKLLAMWWQEYYEARKAVADQ